MSRMMTRATLASGKVTLSVVPRRRILMQKIQALAGRRKKSVSEQVWDLCERALENQEGVQTKGGKIPLPGADDAAPVRTWSSTSRWNPRAASRGPGSSSARPWEVLWSATP